MARPSDKGGLSTTVGLESELDGHGAWYVLVLGDTRFAMHALPEQGEVVIGRSPECDLRIDEPSISRTHARLRVGDGVTIEDLGSVNGTRVDGARLAAGEPARLEPGEQARLGAVGLALHRGAGAQPLQLIDPAELTARAAKECARAAQLGSMLAVGRVVTDGGHASTVERALAQLLRPGDVAAARDGGYDLLLLDCAPDDSSLVVQGVSALLEAAGRPSRIGLAVFPRDGRTAAELAAEAEAAVADDRAGGPAVVVVDPAMKQLYAEAKTLARGDIAVLLLGETGTGKEVLAEAIHRSSPRAAKPFVRINCAGLTESLLESELFGHERGAFTGADRAKPGLLELADGGTVFLDEVGELTPAVQAKLLRVLEDGAILRVGATKPHTVDLRFITATNRELPKEVEDGVFRRDLYYRINGVTLVIPPLRERPDEIEQLARHFAADAARRIGRRCPEVTPEAVDRLRRHDWPGNVRELSNTIERAVLFVEGSELTADHLSFDAPRSPVAAELTERERILEALDKAWGNQSRAAELLGISRRTLINRLDEYDIPRPRKGKPKPAH